MLHKLLSFLASNSAILCL